MKKIFTKKIVLSFLGVIFSICGFAQNMEKPLIEPMENCGIVIPEQCTPEDMIIVINSSIPNLRFESNMLPDSAFKVIYYKQTNQYIICHPRIMFLLTVSGPNLQSSDIEFFNIDSTKTCYRISANMTTGTVRINTTPSNATVTFRDLRDQVLSTDDPITLSSGNYRVNIVKPQYRSIDTVIVIPSNAEKTYNIDFVPLFARIKLDVNSIDKSPFFKPPVIWIDSIGIELRDPRKFSEGVEFLNFYEGNIIPLRQGTHNVKIEAEGYVPYKTTINTKNGEVFTLSQRLEPIFGFITFDDKQLSEGATIFVDNDSIGLIPLFKKKIKVGKHTIRIKKTGFISSEPEYKVTVNENQNTDLSISMTISRKISFETEPSNAGVFMDDNRVGFTPCSVLVGDSAHVFIIRKNGFASEKFIKDINELTPNEEIVKLKLRTLFPLIINGEEEGPSVKLKGIAELQNIETDSTAKIPASVQLPYGKYEISLLRENKTVYKSTINHSSEILKRGKLPNYSRSSFHLLSGSFENKDNYEVSFGRFVVIPGSGLSTSIVNADFNLVNVKADSGYYSIDYSFKTLSPYIFFLNWDWRIGGSVFRQLDINFLGRAKYTPGLKVIAQHIPGYTDVEMQNYFYGIEISTRLSYVNVFFRYGRQINKGSIHYWDLTREEFSKDNFLIDESRNIAAIGITFNGKVSRSNNMLRLWHKPLFDLALRKSPKKEPTQ
jgi:hypothetical protein